MAQRASVTVDLMDLLTVLASHDMLQRFADRYGHLDPDPPGALDPDGDLAKRLTRLRHACDLAAVAHIFAPDTTSESFLDFVGRHVAQMRAEDVGDG